MFRRSNSTSNIPIPKNLFGNKAEKIKGAGIKRSQSVSRLSSRDSLTFTTHHSQPRNPSLDRKSRNQSGIHKLSLSKPENKPSSLLRTTPSTSQRIQRSRSTTPLSAFKNHRSVQKLATDKKWVADQYSKVQNFILTSPLFDTKELSLKPPTINTFLYVTETLFMQAFPAVKLNNNNYKEVIPIHLKALHYPGTLTTSVLKTVNTMHSWPQVIGMWSWLIDKVSLGTYFNDGDDSFLDNLEPEEKQKHLLKQNAWDFLIKEYKIFNDECSTEESEKATKDYVNKIAETLGVDFEEINELKANMQTKKEYQNKKMQEIEHLKVERLKMQSEIEEMQLEIEQFHETDAAEEKELDKELDLLQINVGDLNEAIQAIEQDKLQLEEAIKKQPCTYQEKMDLLCQIAELKDEIKVKKEKIEHAQNIKNKFDHKLASDINKIKSAVIEWNRSLMEISVRKPEFKKLLLREKSFHSPIFLKEIQEVVFHKIAIERNISNALAKVGKDLKIKQEKKEEIEKEIEELIQATYFAQQEYVKLNEGVVGIKEHIKSITSEFQRKQKSHAEYMKELQENTEAEEQAKTIMELRAKRDNLDLEVKEFRQKMLCFFIELSNQITNHIKEMDAIRKTVLKNVEDRASNLLERQKNLIAAINSFNIDNT